MSTNTSLSTLVVYAGFIPGGATGATVKSGPSSPGPGSGGGIFIGLSRIDNKLTDADKANLYVENGEFWDKTNNRTMGAPQANYLKYYRKEVNQNVFNVNDMWKWGFIAREGFSNNTNGRLLTIKALGGQGGTLESYRNVFDDTYSKASVVSTYKEYEPQPVSIPDSVILITR